MKIAPAVAVTAALIALTATFLAATVALSPVAARLPRMIAVVTLALLVAELVAEVTPGLSARWAALDDADPLGARRLRRSDVPARSTAGGERTERRALAWVALLGVLVLVCGLIPALAVFLAVYLRHEAKTSHVRAWVIAIAVAVGVQAVVWALGLPRYGGLFAQWLRP
jgi:hypothetical protein